MTGLRKNGKPFILILSASLVVLAGLAFAAGRFSPGRPGSGSLPQSLILSGNGEWPENGYTADLPKPDAGKVSRGWIDPDKGYCYLELTGVGPAESERYLSALKDAGFSEVKRASEKTDETRTSTAVNLSRGDTSLAISYLDDLFCLYIYQPGPDDPEQ